MNDAPGAVAVPEDMRASFSGSLIQSGDDGYEDARRVHNGLIDKHPALIARCLTTADVVGHLRRRHLQLLQPAIPRLPRRPPVEPVVAVAAR